MVLSLHSPFMTESALLKHFILTSAARYQTEDLVELLLDQIHKTSAITQNASVLVMHAFWFALAWVYQTKQIWKKCPVTLNSRQFFIMGLICFDMKYDFMIILLNYIEILLNIKPKSCFAEYMMAFGIAHVFDNRDFQCSHESVLHTRPSIPPPTRHAQNDYSTNSRQPMAKVLFISDFCLLIQKGPVWMEQQPVND